MSVTMKRNKLQVAVLSIILSLATSILEPLVWIEPSSPLLPRETYANIPAYHDGSIWLVGGLSHIDTVHRYKNLMSYNITNNSFTLHPDLSQGILGYRQNWVQIGDLLYIFGVKAVGSWIGIFNLTSQTYVNNAINTPTLYYPCITEFNDRYLILLSGNINYWNQMKIFDLTADQWISDGPPMPNTRRYFTCHTVNGFLYAIGGLYASDTVVMLEIDNISNITNSWIPLTDTLSIARYSHSSVVYHNLIFVLGGIAGSDGFGSEIQNNVDIINTTTNTISFNSNLSKPLYDIATIVVDDTLFVLSGEPLSNQWQYALLSSESTTTVPTTTTEQSTTSDLSTSISTTVPTTTTTSVLTTTEQSTTSDLSTSISTTFECGHNKNSGPGKAIQCSSDEDCCDGFSCRTKDGPKKGKCGRDKNKRGKHKKNSDSSNQSKSKNEKRSDSSDDKNSKKGGKSDSSDESVETDNSVVNDRQDISASSFDNNVRKNSNNITWIILLIGVSVIFCVMCLILIFHKHLCPKQRMNKNKYDAVSIIVSK